MLGEAPPAFDLLFWNGDGTNLPARMAIEYLRGLCQQDGFAKGTFKVFGEPVSLAGVKVPLCAIACETDHIAHWRGSFNGNRADGIEGQDVHPVRIRAHRGDHQSTHQGQVRALQQRRPRSQARPSVEGRRDLHKRQLVAALGRLACSPLGQADQGPCPGRFDQSGSFSGTGNICHRHTFGVNCFRSKG